MTENITYREGGCILGDRPTAFLQEAQATALPFLETCDQEIEGVPKEKTSFTCDGETTHPFLLG